MNRADQVAEPSMEELLASIRLIISDADKKTSSALREGGFDRQAAADAPVDGAEADEVLNLTDDLVFAEHEEPVAGSGRSGAGLPGSSQDIASAAGSKRDTGAGKRPESALHGGREAAETAAAARPVWSRREIPFPGAAFEPAVPRPRQEGPPPKAKAWAGDVQMAVPEQGPVSLIPPAGSDDTPESDLDEHEEEANGPSGLAVSDEAAVAALAHSLARSAAGAMETSELETARQVDFGHIDEDSKAEVSEKFAEAIEKQSATITKPALPNLLNGVMWQDFRRETGTVETGAEPEAADDTGASPEPHSGATDSAFEESSMVQSFRQSGAFHHAFSQAPAPSQAQHYERASQPSALTVEPSPQALVPSHASMPAPQVRSLEDAVREMLRPLLVQWLNENMPRILEKAIREEIAARGIFPNKDR
jgi:cell pole-organizing protein PopZ